nr:hypothetical protein [Alkalilimnicola ehrlichii]
MTDVIIDPGLPFARIVAKPTAALDRSRQVLLVEGQMDPALLAPDAENSSGGNVNVG